MKSQFACLIAVASAASFATACGMPTGPGDLPPEVMNLSNPGMVAQSMKASAGAAANGSAPASQYLFPRNATPLGSSYEDLSAEWWQWSLSIPKSENPMLGGPCEENQTGDFFFLAGTTGGSAVRSCTIPVGKPIFFPIVNFIYWNCPEYAGGSYTCEMATSEEMIHQWSTALVDDATLTMSLEIDGVAINHLEDYRIHSETFPETSNLAWDDRVWPHCTGPIRDNSCGVPVGSLRNSAGDGFWAMLRPLPVGSHHIRFTAQFLSADGWNFALDVAYDIEVAP